MLPANLPLPELLTDAIIRARVLPVGRRTLQRYVAGNVFPPPDLRLGTKRYWRRETVLGWLAEHVPAHETEGVGR